MTVITMSRNELKQRYSSPFPELCWKFIVFGHNEHELPVAREMARELDMDFYPHLNSVPTFSPVRDPEAVRAATGMSAASRDEYESLHGQSFGERFCHQLWDDPQINWDGKVLGCCVNYWGDFGGNAFRDGLRPSVNTEQIVYARAMLRGHAPPREDIPCTRCEHYEWMRKRGQWLDRGTRRTLKLLYWDFCRRALRWLPRRARRTLKLIYWDFYRRAHRWLPRHI